MAWCAGTGAASVGAPSGGETTAPGNPAQEAPVSDHVYRLSAVAEDRAHAVEDDIFYTGIGLRAATLQLEELRGLLLG